MGSLKAYLSLLRLFHDATAELGLQGLSQADKSLLLYIWTLIDDVGETFYCSYETYVEQGHNVEGISRAQFYRAIASLERNGLLQRVEGGRSQKYMLISA